MKQHEVNTHFEGYEYEIIYHQICVGYIKQDCNLDLIVVGSDDEGFYLSNAFVIKEWGDDGVSYDPFSDKEKILSDDRNNSVWKRIVKNLLGDFTHGEAKISPTHLADCIFLLIGYSGNRNGLEIVGGKDCAGMFDNNNRKYNGKFFVHDHPLTRYDGEESHSLDDFLERIIVITDNTL